MNHPLQAGLVATVYQLQKQRNAILHARKIYTEKKLIGIIKKMVLKEWKARRSTTITHVRLNLFNHVLALFRTKFAYN